MDHLHVFFTSLGSVVALFILTKLIGYKQLSQLTMFDYITGITIGSIAAEMATSLEDDFTKPLLAMAVYAFVSFAISLLCIKSFKFRRIVTGKPVLLLNNGKLYEKNFKKSKMEINEFLMQCRNAGYFDISTIQSALLEANGKISFLPMATERPATPKDLNLSPEQEKICSTVIEDGHIMYENLKYSGLNEEWLRKELKKQGLKRVEDVFLATCDVNKKLTVYIKLGNDVPHDILE